MTTESNGNSEAMQPASQHQEQIAALNADVEAAEARTLQARQNFQTICAQAATALNLLPTTQQGQTLQQALMAAFQWGGEAANASDHALQRRKEVALVEQINAAQEAELKESREHRANEVAESKKRTEILARLAVSTEKLADKGDKFFVASEQLVKLLTPMVAEQKKSVGAGA
jgi:hypothetical protein